MHLGVAVQYHSWINERDAGTYARTWPGRTCFHTCSSTAAGGSHSTECLCSSTRGPQSRDASHLSSQRPPWSQAPPLVFAEAKSTLANRRCLEQHGLPCPACSGKMTSNGSRRSAPDDASDMTIATARRRCSAALTQNQCSPGKRAVGPALPSGREQAVK